MSQTWLCMSVSNAVQRWIQEGQEFKASLVSAMDTYAPYECACEYIHMYVSCV